MLGGEAVLSGCVLEEDGDAIDEQGAGQAIDDGIQQRFEIGEGAEASTEGDEGGTVIVALAVEEAVDAHLDGSLERLEEERRYDDGGQESPDTEAAQAGLSESGGDGKKREIDADEGGGGEGVGDAALEDEVDVHHAIAHDGPAEGEREDDHADAGDFGEGIGHGDVGHVGNGGQERERRDGEQGAAGEPLELLAFKGGFGFAVVHVKDGGREDIEERLMADGNLVETMAEDFRCRPELDRHDLQGDDGGGGEIDERHEPAPALSLFRGKCQCEVQEERGLECVCADLAPLDDPVELVELAGGPEGVEDERNEAKDIEVGGMGGGPASQQHIEADAEIDQSDEAETLVDAAVLHVEDDRNIGQADAVAHQGVVDGVVGPGAPDFTGQVRAYGGRLVVGCDEQIAGLDAGSLAGAVGWDALSL